MTETLAPQPEDKITRSSGKLDKTNRVGIFPKTYIFCGKIIKTELVNIKKYVNLLDDKEMLLRISNIDFIANAMDFVGQNTKLELQR